MDTKCWAWSLQKTLRSNHFIKVLHSHAHQPFPWKSAWKPKVPTKVSLFFWVTKLRKILTTYNLQRQWVVVLDWYCMCKRDRKIVEHLLLHYPIARELWELLFSQFGVCSIMTRGVVELFACWLGWFSSYSNVVIWCIIPHCLMWGL